MMTFYLKKSIPIRTEACIFFLKELLNIVTSFTFKDSYYIAFFTCTDIYIYFPEENRCKYIPGVNNNLGVVLAE